MPVESPVSERLTVISLLLLTFATGIVDAVSVLALGHVFVANMTGNVIFLGFWFVPHSGVDMTAAVVAFASFVAQTSSQTRIAAVPAVAKAFTSGTKARSRISTGTAG